MRVVCANKCAVIMRIVFPLWRLRNEKVREAVYQGKQIPMRYVNDDGESTQQYPFNPNGSPDGIVGLCSPDGRHLAMMPHPERLTAALWQWPWAPQEWTEGPAQLAASPWLQMFQNVREWCDDG